MVQITHEKIQGGAREVRSSARLHRKTRLKGNTQSLAVIAKVSSGVYYCYGAVSGCAIHPLPDDVAHISTYTVVRQVRCEPRQAVIDALFRYPTSPSNLRFNRLDEYSLNVGRQLKQTYAGLERN